jgi:leucyl-tRNA synthetase
VGFNEPFRALFTQGMICKQSSITHKLEKMSKSKGNVVSPDAVIAEYGADTQRLYTLFIGPPQKDAEWQDDAVVGARRFLDRVWRQVEEALKLGFHAAPAYNGDGADLAPPTRKLWHKTHQTIRKVTSDIDTSWQFNTAIAAVMELSNEFAGWMKDVSAPGAAGGSRGQAELGAGRLAIESLVRLLSPIVPHFAEELWEKLGHQPSILDAGWPEFVAAACLEDVLELAVQVNGKLRDRITVPADATEEQISAVALAAAKVKDSIGAATVRKVIVIPGRLVNIVAK